MPLGLCPRPRDLSLWRQSRSEKGVGRPLVAPSSDLGPWDGARVISQQSPILRPGHLNCSLKKRRFDKQDSARLFDPSCNLQLEVPPVRAISRQSVDAWHERIRSSPYARRVDWRGLYGEEFALDTSASATTRQSLSRKRERYLAKECVGSNRNEKNDCNFPRRRQPDESTLSGQQTDRRSKLY